MSVKLSERKRQLLNTIAQSPRRANHFTQGRLDQITAPEAVQKWLDDLHGSGYLTEDAGVYTITHSGRKALDIKPGAATMRELQWRDTTYDASKHQDIGTQYQRPGSDHSHLQSFGTKC